MSDEDIADNLLSWVQQLELVVAVADQQRLALAWSQVGSVLNDMRAVHRALVAKDAP